MSSHLLQTETSLVGLFPVCGSVSLFVTEPLLWLVLPVFCAAEVDQRPHKLTKQVTFLLHCFTLRLQFISLVRSNRLKMDARERNNSTEYNTGGRSPPMLDPNTFGYWKLRFRAHLAAKGVLYVVDEQKVCPEVDQTRVNSLRRQNRQAEAETYTSTMAKAKTDWIRDHAIAFNETVTSAGNNFDATTLIMQNKEETVSQLLTKFDERFGIEGQVGTIQSKVAGFNLMLIDTATKEKGSRFSDRLARAGLEINQSGSGELINMDIHGVSRLKEGLLHDPRYEVLCHVLRGQPNITWAQAVNQILDFERSNEVFLSSHTAKPSAGSQQAPV